MSSHDCGCGGAQCGCCEGVTPMTPVPIAPRPGLPALPYRVGTHGRFMASMQARLPGTVVTAPGPDGQTPQTFRPLAALTTRDPADPALALLDAWACVGDVLTFYQERIANEGYLRTAGERRSLVELARLVGYTPRPGVSASVHLSYTVDPNQVEPVEVPVGTRAQSIPGPDELPQTFETDEPMQARREWNDLGIRRQRPQAIDAATLPALPVLYVAGTDNEVRAGDLLLFEFTSGPAAWQVRRVQVVETDFEAQRTTLRLQPLEPLWAQALPLLNVLVYDLERLGDVRAIRNATNFRNWLYLGADAWPMGEWAERLLYAVEGPSIDRIKQFGDALAQLQQQAATPVTSTPDQAVDALLLPPQVQAANRLRLRRDLDSAFARGADLQPQLITRFAPRLRDSYYAAWRGSDAGGKPASLRAVHLLGPGQSLFGATSARPTPVSSDSGGVILKSFSSWDDWTYAEDETNSNAYLSSPDVLLAAGAWVLAARPGEDLGDPTRLEVLRVARARSGPRSAYGINAETTRLDFGDDTGKPTEWRKVEAGKEGRAAIGELRATWLHPARRVLALAEAPVLDEVYGDQLELAPLHEQLTSGRWVVVEGERSDIAGVRGVQAAELMMVAGLRHGQDSELPGDRPHTTLQLATPLAYRYHRASVVVRGNVVAASHGESRREVLGGSDARQPLQAFTLRQPPLTFRPAPTAVGATSTLKVYVNDVAWHEATSLAQLGPDDRAFVTRTDGDGGTTVVFGDGEHGLRPPSGLENLRAEYRNGLGRGGNVRAGQVALMVSRPLGLKDVVNPLRAAGGADRESERLIRENAPRSVIALDRLVSLSDYADFTRLFAGIAKADARRLADAGGEYVHVSFADVDDMPFDIDSDLYRNLAQALRTLGDPGLTVRLAWRERIALVLQARLRLLPDYRWEPVATAVRARLLERFGFDARALAQPALLCEVIAAIQSVPGIDWVDVDSFGGIADTEPDPQTGLPRLVSQAQITAQVRRIVHGEPGEKGSSTSTLPVAPPDRVDARPARLEDGLARPAQIACFMPDVADTLILNPDP